MTDDKTPDSNGILINAENGDVIRYDDTGLTMRLSDTVLADIAMRLGHTGSETAHIITVPRVDAHAYLPGVDAWGVSLHGDWLYFTANLAGAQGPRGFRRRVAGGDIIADAPGPVLAVLGLGGARAALGTDAVLDFPCHILSPADDIGAVGHAGVEDAVETAHLEHLRDLTLEALVAQSVLHDRMAHTAALPLFVARVETDTSATAMALANGPALDNLVMAARNTMQAAATMGKTAQIMAITLDYSFEDQSGSASAYRDGMIAVMTAVRDRLGALGYGAPKFVARFDGGSPAMQAAHVIQGQWELAWNHADHDFIHSAPGYMFAMDDYDRPTDAARADMAAMTAAAVGTDDWHCPTFLLAERIAGTTDIRVTAKAMGPLVLDDALGAGPTAGFTLTGADAHITHVRVDPDDPKALIVTCDTGSAGDVHLEYGTGTALTGGVHDDWRLQNTLHRWALPCRLLVTGTF